MNQFNGDKNFIRQNIFLDQLKKDKNFILKFNKYYNTIKSSSYLLVSLDYSMEKKIYNSIKFLIFASIVFLLTE